MKKHPGYETQEKLKTKNTELKSKLKSLACMYRRTQLCVRPREALLKKRDRENDRLMNVIQERDAKQAVTEATLRKARKENTVLVRKLTKNAGAPADRGRGGGQ